MQGVGFAFVLMPNFSKDFRKINTSLTTYNSSRVKIFFDKKLEGGTRYILKLP